MGRRKRPIAFPPPRDPFEAWGDVPTDQRAERKRLARIVARNGRRIANYRAFCRGLGAACHEANWALYERLRHDPSARTAILEDRLEKASAFRKALAAPAHDADEPLSDAMALDARNPPKEAFPWQLLEGPPDGLFAPRLEERTDWLVRAVADYERWIAKALADIGKPGPGRRPDDVTRNLVRRLGEVWRAQTGRAPTLITDADTQEKYGAFSEFCEAVITPIWRNRGLEPPCIKAFVRDYCYPLR
jgi:hypothetical protein